MARANEAKWRILVVDNEPLVTESIRWILVHDGHVVEVTSNAEQVTSLFQKGKFDLIIADYQMPKLKGDELAARIHALDPEQRFLLITAHTEELLAKNAPLKGVDMVLGKPFDVEALRSAVAQLATKS
jgi:two-component system response regulator SaeR